MQLSNLTTMLSDPLPTPRASAVGEKRERKVGELGGDSEVFHNWSGRDVVQIILPLMAAHPKVIT